MIRHIPTSRFYLLFSLFVLTFFSTAAQTEDFIFADQTFQPGSKSQILIPVKAGNDSTVIPVTVFHGLQKGPVLGIVAGVHGTEYVPILAAQQLAKQLDPKELSGTVILVHMANVEGFLKRSFRVNPLDGKNLNRVFPGSEDGTMTEKIAWTISNKIIPHLNFYVDVHAGDSNNDLRQYSGYYNYFDKPEVSNKAKEMAIAMGFPYIVQFGNEQSLQEESVYTSREAFKQNIPAVDIESGRMGIVEEKYVVRIQDALWSLMQHLEILEGTPDAVENPIVIKKRTNVISENNGFFYSDFTSGDYVKKGIKLGYITDLFGNHLSDVICPVDGVILYKTFNPPIEKGNGLFNIGHLE